MYLRLSDRKKVVSQIRDKTKTDYCNQNGIELIRIPFFDYNKVEEILEKRLC